MSTTNLKNLDQIFTKNLLRIPDYQRGYSWRDKFEVEVFWEDLINLDDSSVHYTGVVTLESVPNEKWESWEDDEWLIVDRSYNPYYIVDGQQRLATAIILIQSLLESAHNKSTIANHSLDEIKKQFILFVAPEGIRKSYLFGYEKDDPSYEFLKSRIFCEHSHSDSGTITLYTRNLSKAKSFFKEKLTSMGINDLDLIFKKLTQKLKFNMHIIDSAELDVHVTFETINNRGKPLSNLELLKNRLIYLSTLFLENQGRDVLRKEINDTWKTIYEFLGKNPDAPLSDDHFLKDHWIMAFTYRRAQAAEYINFLLKDKFTARNVRHGQLTIDEIQSYATNLQQSIKPWFYIQNPNHDIPDYDKYCEDKDNRKLLNRLVRLGFSAFGPLFLAAYVGGHAAADINDLLKRAERYNFLLFKISRRRSNTGDSEFYRSANSLFKSIESTQDIGSKIDYWRNDYFDPAKFFSYIEDKYKHEGKGFYGWDGLHYFLYEYEQDLRSISRQQERKLIWREFAKIPNRLTIEHIYPQNDTDKYWPKYCKFDDIQKYYLCHSLGNLLAISRVKNSSILNYSFEVKKDTGNGVGYYNGSYSEIEVSQNSEWTAKNILNRGIKMLEFMEKRWEISVGNTSAKIKLLHLDFLEL